MASTDDAFAKQKGVFRHSWRSVSSSTSAKSIQSRAEIGDPFEYHFVFSQNARTSPKARRHIIDQVNRRKQSRKQHALRPTKKLGGFQWQKKAQNSEQVINHGEVSGRGSSESFPKSPQTPVGAGRVDPFASMPGRGGGLENELIDHCKSSASASMLLCLAMFAILFKFS